jgi:hypothetical protein
MAVAAIAALVFMSTGTSSTANAPSESGHTSRWKVTCSGEITGAARTPSDCTEPATIG